MIHIGKIKNKSKARKSIRKSKSKSGSKFLLLPTFRNLQKNTIFLTFGFFVITLTLLSSVSLISQNSSFDASATQDDARLITNYHYQYNEDGGMEVKPFEE